jgi:hypothetical protein
MSVAYQITYRIVYGGQDMEGNVKFEQQKNN